MVWCWCHAIISEKWSVKITIRHNQLHWLHWIYHHKDWNNWDQSLKTNTLKWLTREERCMRNFSALFSTSTIEKNTTWMTNNSKVKKNKKSQRIKSSQMDKKFYLIPWLTGWCTTKIAKIPFDKRTAQRPCKNSWTFCIKNTTRPKHSKNSWKPYWMN